MASVFERNGRWYLRVKDGRGRWIKVPSGARTKTEARRLVGDLEQRYERQRLGLEALPAEDGGGTLGQLLDWWLETYSARSPSHERNVYVVNKHLLAADMAGERLVDLHHSHVEAFLHAKGAELKPASVNRLRRFLLTAFNRAREVGRYAGPNPVAAVKSRRVAKATHDYLRAIEIPSVLAAVPRVWRALFAAAIYTGLRRGELFALRKHDVDLQARLLTVAGSHDRATTKGGHGDVIPIAEELLPFLEQAITVSPSGLVFPRVDGGRWPANVNLCRVLRQAMAIAGIVLGWLHVCRRPGCSHREAAPDSALRRCAKHVRTPGPKLWPVPQVRPIRFHDLRHTTASLMMMAGANPVAVQRVMRHSDVRITTEVYGHLAPEYLRAEVDRLRFNTTPVAPPKQVRAVANAAPFVPVVSPMDVDTMTLPRPPIGKSAQGLGIIWRPQGDSNPCRRRERAVS